MSYKWPSKSPAEILDYSFDWSRLLGSAQIATTTWYVTTDSTEKTEFITGFTLDGLTNGGEINSSTVSTIVLVDGTLNVQYRITCLMTDSLGRTAERNAILVVRER
jgi:hypothetical protein